MAHRISQLALAAAAAALAVVPPASGHAGNKRCPPRASQVVARHGQAVIYLRNTGPDDGEYGAPSALFGCKSARSVPRRLVNFPDGDTPTFAKLGANGARARFVGRYVAFSLSYIDIVCSKYAQPNCATSITGSFDLGNGRQRATARGPATAASDESGFTAADLALTTMGWFAWIPAQGGPPQPLIAAGRHDQGTLDPGPIDAGSLSASGTTVSWTSGAQSHSATLR